MVWVIGLDCDDTLWHNETLFKDVEGRFAELVSAYVADADVATRLVTTERRNVEHFGYGAKSFALSMIETAVEVTDGRVSASDLARILDWAKELLGHPVELLPGVGETVDELLGGGNVLGLITKGDLLHQQNKIAASGLADRVDWVEVVAEKDEATYATILDRHRIDPATFLMVGNSLRSDVLPVLGIGARAVHIPYHVTWALEESQEPHAVDGYWELEDIRQLPKLLAEL